MRTYYYINIFIKYQIGDSGAFAVKIVNQKSFLYFTERRIIIIIIFEVESHVYIKYAVHQVVMYICKPFFYISIFFNVLDCTFF